MSRAINRFLFATTLSLPLPLLLLSSFRDRVTLIHRASPSPLKQSLSIIFPFLSPDGELYENSAIFIRPKLTRRMVKQRSTRALNMLICVIALAGIFEWGEGGNGAREERENSNFPRRVSRIKPGPGIATFRPITLIRS